MSKKHSLGSLIFLLAFFSYAGYYAGLALIMSFGNVELSRYYSVPLRLILVLVMIILITQNFKNGERHFDKGYLPVMFFFVLIYIIKVVFTEATYDGLSRTWYEYIFYFLSYSVIPFFAFAFISFEKNKKLILDAFILSGFILGALSLYLYKDILRMGIGRISMIKYELSDRQTLSPLALSYSGVLTIVLCVYKLVYEKAKSLVRRGYLYLNAVLSFIMFFLGASRGSLVVLLLCIPFILYHGSYRNKFKILLLCAIAIPLIIYGAEVTGSSIFDRAEETIETGNSNGRGELWTMAWREFKDHVLLGGRIEVSGIYPHNLFLEVLMSTGILGFFLFAVVLFRGIFRAVKMIKYDKSYMIPTLILINGLAQNMFSGSIYDASLLFISMGMIYSSFISTGRIRVEKRTRFANLKYYENQNNNY